jgi:predicted Na+-dependent transporter
MLFPVPIIIGWFLAVGLEGKFPEFSIQRLQDLAHWIGLSFLALALAVAMFVRLRQRWLKISVLVISGLFTLAMVAFYAKGELSWPVFLVLILVMFGLFLTPALVERKIRCNRIRRLARTLSG